MTGTTDDEGTEAHRETVSDPEQRGARLDASAGSPDGEPPGARSGAECQEALDTLYHYLDGELDDQRRRNIQQHLERCSPCLEAFDFEAELKVVVAQRCREVVPEGLRNRVADALAQASRTFDGSV